MEAAIARRRWRRSSLVPDDVKSILDEANTGRWAGTAALSFFAV